MTQYLDLGRWGDHEIGAGGGYYRNAWEGHGRWTGTDFDLWPGNGFDNGVQITWMEPGSPLTAQEEGPTTSNNATEGIHAYIQDSVTIGRLSFMLGLRSETQAVFNDLGERVWRWGFDDFPSTESFPDFRPPGRWAERPEIRLRPLQAPPVHPVADLLQ